MQIKHFIPLLTALALCGLAACGGSGESASASSSEASSAQGQEPTALDRYRGVLFGQDSDSSYAAVGWFTVLDLDGDGTEEAVLQITDAANDMGGYLVLRCQEEMVLGYPSGWRTFWDLKTDGTFFYSQAGGSEDGLASIRFTEDGLVLDKYLYGTGDWFRFYDFYLDGQAISKEEYDLALLEQDEKPDAQWYAFTQEELQQVLGGAPA